MAVQAYVFIECVAGTPYAVAEGLTKVAGVETAHAVTGAYDVIAFVWAESVPALGEFISRHIHTIPGVLRTVSNVVVHKPAAPA